MADGEIIPIVAIALLFGIPIVAMLAHYGYYGWKAWLELNLKREMVARGYTAEEIVHVLQAKTGGNWQAEAPPPWMPQAENQPSAKR
jgi:hypothetical protein